MSEKKIMILLLLVALGFGVASFVLYSFDSDDHSVEENGENRTESEGEDEEVNVDSEDLTASQLEELVSCLNNADVVIYGSKTCPYCNQLVKSLGGTDNVEPIYVECSDETERCRDELIGRGVPEIQIEGEMYQGSRDPEDIGSAVNCEIDR
ncbi:MAG: glutaredoxin domain-containing protein [Patescibacteria group bacterium]